MAGFEDTGGSVARAGGVSSGAAAKDIKTLYKAVYLKNRQPKLVYQQFAAKQDNDTNIPLNKGDNIEYTRYAPLNEYDPGSRPYALLVEGTTPEPEKYYAQTVTAVLDEYGSWIKPSSRTWLTAYDPKLGGLISLLGIQSGKTLELKIQNILAQGFMPMRADSDTTNQGERTCVTADSTVNVIKTNTIPASITTGSTGVVVFLSGRNEGITRTFTYTSTTSVTLTVALPYSPLTGDRVWMCSTLGLTTGDRLTPALVKRAVAKLEDQEAPLFDDGYYHAIIPRGGMKYDFMNDTEYVNLKHYAAPKDLYRNLVGEFSGVRFHESTVPYRHTAGTLGTYVASAVPRMVSMFGKWAFGNVRLAGKDQKFYVNPPPEEGTTTNPLGMFGTIGWKNMYAPLVLNGAWGLNIFCVPTVV